MRNGKRVYVHEFKLGLVRRCCLEPDVSVSAVALEHGINANLLRKWIDKHRAEVDDQPIASLLPVTIAPIEATSQAAPEPVPATPRECGSSIEIEVFGARLILRGEIDARRLRAVLEALRRA
jgi:transposase